MKKTTDLIKMFLCVMVAVFAVFGCSNTALLTSTGADTTAVIDNVSNDGMVTVELKLPATRSWDIAKYQIVATFGDEDPITYESQTQSLSVRLKIGKWSFTANALDAKNNILYSAATTATLGLKTSQVYIGLIKRAGRVIVKMNMDGDDAITGAYRPQKFVVTAVKDSFTEVTGESASIDDTVTLTGLAQGEWTINAAAYSVSSDDPTGEATVLSYSGSATVNIVASETISQSIKLSSQIVAPPTFSHSGQVKSGQTVTISSQQSAAKIYVTTDGSNPAEGNSANNPANPYVLTIDKAVTVKAAACKNGQFSEVVTKNYTVVESGKCVMPQIKPEAQVFSSPTNCVIECDEVGAAIYYTTDGSEPTASSTYYSASFKIDREMTVKAIAVKSGLENSDVASVAYGYKEIACAVPTIDPASGVYNPGQKITITQNTSGAKTYYRVSDNETAVADAADSDTKSFEGGHVDLDTTDWSAGKWYVSAYSAMSGRPNSDMTKVAITIQKNDGENVAYKLIDNLIVATKEDNLWTSAGMLATGSEVWFGFTHDAGGSIYVDADPADSLTINLYKNGTNSNAELVLKNNIHTLPEGANYYYLKLTAKSQVSNAKVRVYTTTSPDVTQLESLAISAAQSVKVGGTATITAVATYSDDSSRTVTPVYTYDNTVISISNNVITGLKVGETDLTASYTDDGITKDAKSIKITVTKGDDVVTLESLTIAAAGSVTAPAFTATANYSNGTTQTVTDSVTWTSSTEATATIAKGVVTLKAAGTTKITSSYTESGKTVTGAEYTVTVTSTGGGDGVIDKVYFIPSTTWTDASPRYAAYFFNNSSSNEWVDMTASNGVYVCGRPATTYANVIFCRMNPGTTDNNWNNKWNQTGDLSLPTDKDTFQLAEGVWDNGTSAWLDDLTGSYGGGDVVLSATVEKTGDDPTPTTTTTLPPDPISGLFIFVKSSSAPKLWAWEDNGTALCEELGETWDTQSAMVAAVGMNDGEGWYMKDFSSLTLKGTGTIKIILNQGSTIDSGMKDTFWYDGSTFYAADPTTKKDPVKPTVTISPATGSTVKTTGAISVTFTNGYDTITSAKVTVDGTVYDMGTSAGTWSKTMSDMGITTDNKSFTVSASVTNGQGTTTVTASYTSLYVDPSKADVFTWDNVNAYFVLTDRFYNGNTSNDHSYSRSNNSSNSSVPDVATFHGGDIAGLTAKLDYFTDLGVNAIWITAPYEQVHGWVGGKNGAFPHYAFHGYYTLDWTAMDQNMGTVEELRTFVNACHSKGIRVIMDVVMNHVGYNNLADMITYPHGSTTVTDASWIGMTDGQWVANIGIDWSSDNWRNWWGPFIRSFMYEEGSEYGGSCGGLPDVKTELTNSVGLPPVMVTKWGTDSSAVKSAYYNPSVANVDWLDKQGDYRTDKGVAPGDYQVAWLSAWVREVGIDGFRCDTAKHVEPWRWGQLKVACQAALEKWRADKSKDKTYNGADTGAADWEQNFWMTGECWGWTAVGGSGGDYYGTGKFDSMINFSFNGSQTSGTTSNYPSTSSWSSYLSLNNSANDDDGNGNHNNVLTYISSHDTALCRPSSQKAAGTGLILLPGGVQIYYGDESARGQAYTSCGDSDMMTRGDMNWNNSDCVTHWGKIGKFRKYNPAVGAGTGSATKRTYSGAAGTNSVAISVSGTTVDVSGLFANGDTVYNWYDGQSAQVSGGSVTFAGGTMEQPILVSDKDPSAY